MGGPKRRTSSRPRGKILTADEHVIAKARFLETYATSGLILSACQAANIERSTYHRWMEHDEEFVLGFHQARAMADDQIRAEIKRRGIDGCRRDVYYQGEVVGHYFEYSDRMLELMAKSRMAEFREKQQIEHTGTISIIDLIRSAVAVGDDGASA